MFHDHYHSYGLLMDSFESVTANVVQKASQLSRALFQTIDGARSHYRDRALCWTKALNERDNQSSHASITVSKRLAATALPARRFG